MVFFAIVLLIIGLVVLLESLMMEPEEDRSTVGYFTGVAFIAIAAIAWRLSS